MTPTPPATPPGVGKQPVPVAPRLPAAPQRFLKTCFGVLPRPIYVRALGLSIISGLLMLTPSWFMFEVYGRVLNSRNQLTLLMLLLAAVGLYVLMELLDLVRARLLHRAAELGDQQMRLPLFDTMFRLRAEGRPVNQTQAFADLRTLREFIPSQPVAAALDLPAASIFLVLLFAIGPLPVSYTHLTLPTSDLV